MKLINYRSLILIGCISLLACSKAENRWGGVTGGQRLKNEPVVQLCYDLQGGTYSGAFDSAKARPQFVILWKARRVGSSSSDSNNRLSEIHGHNISVSFSEEAVYALQPDYTLKRIPLSTTETNQIFDSFMVSYMASAPIILDDLWSRSVTPHLAIVEDPKWNPPPTTAKP